MIISLLNDSSSNIDLLRSLKGVVPQGYHAKLNSFIRSRLQRGSDELGDLVTDALPHLRLDIAGISV